MNERTWRLVKRIIFAVVIVVSLIPIGIIAVGVAIVTDDGHNAAGRAFDPVLKKVVVQQDFTTTLNTMTAFPWETVCWLEPYGTGPFEAHYGSLQAAMEQMPWSTRESHWGLVFVGRDQAVTPVSISRRTADYTDFIFPGPCLCGEVTLTRTKGGAIAVNGNICAPRLSGRNK